MSGGIVGTGEGQHTFIKAEAIVAVLLQIDLYILRRRGAKDKAQRLAATVSFHQRQRAIIGGSHSDSAADHTQCLHHH